MGQNCVLTRIIPRLIAHLNEDHTQKEPLSIEWMCHPGFKSFKGDDFNRSDGRLHEFQVLTSDELNQGITSLQLERSSFRRLDE